QHVTPAVELGQLPGNAGALHASLAEMEPATTNPTGPALAGSLAHAKTWASDHAAAATAGGRVDRRRPGGCPIGLPELRALAWNSDPPVRTRIIALGTDADDGEDWPAIASASGGEATYTVTGQDVMAELLDAFGAASVTMECQVLVSR